jgi:Glycosyl transferase family 2
LNLTDISIVVETINYQEGSGIALLRRAIDAALTLGSSAEKNEVLLVDVVGDLAVNNLVADSFPRVRRIDALGMGYDAAKSKAVEQAKGDYVVFLDGDCLPEPGWLERLVGPLRNGACSAGGFSRYHGGFVASVLSIMDFGFLLPRAPRQLGCYASNNVAFQKQAYLDHPIADGPLRCKCYSHARALAHAGRPVLFAPTAVVKHALPPTIRERLRQGYDAVAVCWMDPTLKEAKWTRFGIAAAPKFYWRIVTLDWKRVFAGYQDVELSRWQAFFSLPFFPILRLIDLIGILFALGMGPKARRWVDWGAGL